jgi:hypothetical protein
VRDGNPLHPETMIDGLAVAYNCVSRAAINLELRWILLRLKKASQGDDELFKTNVASLSRLVGGSADQEVEELLEDVRILTNQSQATSQLRAALSSKQGSASPTAGVAASVVGTTRSGLSAKTKDRLGSRSAQTTMSRKSAFAATAQPAGSSAASPSSSDYEGDTDDQGFKKVVSRKSKRAAAKKATAVLAAAAAKKKAAKAAGTPSKSSGSTKQKTSAAKVKEKMPAAESSRTPKQPRGKKPGVLVIEPSSDISDDDWHDSDSDASSGTEDLLGAGDGPGRGKKQHRADRTPFTQRRGGASSRTKGGRGKQSF